MTVSHLKNEIARLIAEYQLEDQVRVIVETDKQDHTYAVNTVSDWQWMEGESKELEDDRKI